MDSADQNPRPAITNSVPEKGYVSKELFPHGPPVSVPWMGLRWTRLLALCLPVLTHQCGCSRR